MASPFLLPSQVFQSPVQSAALNSPLLLKFNIRSNYDGDNTLNFRAGKQLLLSFCNSNPSENKPKHSLDLHETNIVSPIKRETHNLGGKNLVNRIRALALSSNVKTEKNDLDEAERLLNTILENRVHPDVTTITILINSFCKRGRIKKALEIFELMNRVGTKPTVQIYNCLLKGLCYVGKVEEAFEMLMKMKKREKNFLKPDIYSYTCVMDGFCKVGRSDEARELLNEAEVEMGLTPNVVTFNTLFQGYSREGRPLEGMSVLKLMKKKKCVPDYISYSTLLHGLLKWDEIKHALSIYKEMERFGFEVDVRMMGNLVRRLCRKSRKERALLDDAYLVFEKMTERDIAVDQRTFEVVVEAFCAQGRIEEAVSSLVLVYAKGTIPSGFCFDVVINELNAQGRLICASSLYGCAMKLGVVPTEEPFVCQS